jgi:hypothetical protein
VASEGARSSIGATGGTRPQRSSPVRCSGYSAGCPRPSAACSSTGWGWSTAIPHDLADTARALGLSMSEAREIEKRAFEHIREAVPLQQLQRFLER